MKKILLIVTFLLTFSYANSQTIWMSETKLKGTIGKYEIFMTLAVPYGGASSCFTVGKYFYVSKKKKIDLCSEDDEKIIENTNGIDTGYFIINNWDKKVGQTVVGSWHTMDGRKSYPVVLKVIGKGKY
jgi:hypothetical protein